jgi:OFA family oxalate/formate antiporter-like MFS transporter
VERSVPKQERWIVLVAAVGFLTVAGAAYSWSLYTRPLMAFFGWSSVEVALGFSLLIVFIATGAIAGGFLHDWFGPRWVSVGGAVMWGLGSLLAGLGLNTSGLWWLYLTYSAIGGFGCGMMYVVPGACVTKWFPEERGLANGIVLCGFGLGSLFFNLIVSAYAPFARIVDLANRIESGREAAAAAGHPYVMIPGIAHAGIGVIAQVFLWSGVAFLILGVICALVLHPPPAGFSVAKMAGRPVERNVAPREMFRSRAFYLIWSMILINSTCGLALFGNGVAIYAHVAGVGGVAAVATFGWLSSANGFGRLLWAWLSDDVGRMRAFAICFVVEGIGLAWIARSHGVIDTSIAFVLTTLSFGGIFGIAPAAMADFFGTRFLGEDYSFIISAAALGGLIGPLLAASLEDSTGSLTVWLNPLAIVLVVTAVVTLIAGRPAKPVATAGVKS